MSRFFLVLRSVLFLLVLPIPTVVWAFACFLFAPLPYATRYWLTARWNVFVIGTARVLCGIRYRIIGLENLPDGPAILLSKHQSAWETIFFMCVMPRPVVFVFKKELLYIPFFGWGLALLRMIPIDRSKGRDAFAQVLEHGRKRLNEGRWIVMFPEGTRIPVGQRGRYKGGGTRLAVETATPIVPIALNSGECWPKNSFVKKPGLITVSIGKPISPEGRTPADLIEQVEHWIESEMRVISPGVYLRTSAISTREAASTSTV